MELIIDLHENIDHINEIYIKDCVKFKNLNTIIIKDFDIMTYNIFDNLIKRLTHNYKKI